MDSDVVARIVSTAGQGSLIRWPTVKLWLSVGTIRALFNIQKFYEHPTSRRYTAALLLTSPMGFSLKL